MLVGSLGINNGSGLHNSQDHKRMIIYDIIKWLNIFIVLNPFLSMLAAIIIGMLIDRLYLRLNPNYQIWKGKK